MPGCSLAGSHMDRVTPLYRAWIGVSFGFATQPSAGEGVAGESDRPMPLQTAADSNRVTASPQIAAFNFGATPVGTMQQVTWTITNVGDAASGALGSRALRLSSAFPAEREAGRARAHTERGAPLPGRQLGILNEPQFQVHRKRDLHDGARVASKAMRGVLDSDHHALTPHRMSITMGGRLQPHRAGGRAWLGPCGPLSMTGVSACRLLRVGPTTSSAGLAG